MIILVFLRSPIIKYIYVYMPKCINSILLKPTGFVHSQVWISVTFVFDVDIQLCQGPCPQFRMKLQHLLPQSENYSLVTEEGGF